MNMYPITELGPPYTQSKINFLRNLLSLLWIKTNDVLLAFLAIFCLLGVVLFFNSPLYDIFIKGPICSY